VNSSKRYLIIAATFAICMAVFAAFTPSIAHAISATLVQVVNGPSNPVPVQSVATTQQLYSSVISLGNLITASSGFIDTSSAGKIRVSCNTQLGATDWQAKIRLRGADGFILSLLPLKDANNPTGTANIEVPGPQIDILLVEGAGPADVRCDVYGRP
jgi:hypothetical protein